MKKFTALILSIVLAFLLTGCIDEVSMLYTEDAEKDGLTIVINKTAHCCFVGRFEYTDETEITVPDEYNGIPITILGGYFGRGVPSPFTISLAKKYINAEDNKYFFSKDGRLYDKKSGEEVEGFSYE